MVRVWFMNDTDEDQREAHMTDPPQFIEMDKFNESTGVEYFKYSPENVENNEELNKLRKDRGYSYHDVCEVSRETLPNYDEKLKSFFTEHIHADEEIRFCIAGSGYFDVRDKTDKWIRVELNAGDMIVLPSGIYHRFTLDTNNYIKVFRYFVGDPVWTPINRPADDHPKRQEYLENMKIEA